LHLSGMPTFYDRFHTVLEKKYAILSQQQSTPEHVVLSKVSEIKNSIKSLITEISPDEPSHLTPYAADLRVNYINFICSILAPALFTLSNKSLDNHIELAKKLMYQETWAFKDKFIKTNKIFSEAEHYSLLDDEKNTFIMLIYMKFQKFKEEVSQTLLTNKPYTFDEYNSDNDSDEFRDFEDNFYDSPFSLKQFHSYIEETFLIETKEEGNSIRIETFKYDDPSVDFDKLENIGPELRDIILKGYIA